MRFFVLLGASDHLGGVIYARTCRGQELTEEQLI